jgi:hypothetical protein
MLVQVRHLSKCCRKLGGSRVCCPGLRASVIVCQTVAFLPLEYFLFFFASVLQVLRVCIFLCRCVRRGVANPRFCQWPHGHGRVRSSAAVCLEVRRSSTRTVRYR